jgi:hypothetical protein
MRLYEGVLIIEEGNYQFLCFYVDVVTPHMSDRLRIDGQSSKSDNSAVAHDSLYDDSKSYLPR